MATQTGFSFQTTDMANYYASANSEKMEVRFQIPKEHLTMLAEMQDDDTNHYVLLTFRSPYEWQNFINAMNAIDGAVGCDLTGIPEEEAN